MKLLNERRVTWILMALLFAWTASMSPGCQRARDHATMCKALKEANALEIVTFIGRYGSADTLVRYESDPRALAPGIHLACSYGREDTLRYLLRCGANPNAVDLRGRNALSFAICRAEDSNDITNKLPLFSILLEAKADPNQQDGDGANAVMYASEFGFTGLLTLLVKTNVNLQLKNCNGDTALHEAKSPECALVLIKSGADPLAKNKSGETPEQFALRMRHFAVARFLSAYQKQKD